MYIQEVGWEGDVDGIGLAEDRKRERAFVKSVMNISFP
jgi:hypothetical protein